VPAAEQRQLAVDERLHADRQPVDTSGAQRAQARRREVRRIRLGGDLDVGGKGETPGEPVEDGGDLRRRE
jgi:hypothetical protein